MESLGLARLGSARQGFYQFTAVIRLAAPAPASGISDRSAGTLA